MNRFKIVGIVKKVSQLRMTKTGVGVIDLWLGVEDDGRTANVAVTLFHEQAGSIEQGMTIALFGRARTFKAEAGPDAGRWVTKIEANEFDAGGEETTEATKAAAPRRVIAKSAVKSPAPETDIPF